MNFAIEHKKHFLIILFYMSFTPITFSQVDSINIERNILILSPTLHSIQIDATSIILIHQIGGQFDFDILRSNDKNICIGTRVSIEHYYLTNFVEKVDGSPFTNYNLFARLSNRKDYLSISMLGGITYYTTADPSYIIKDRYLFRAGMEAEYGIGFKLVFKASTSFIEKSAYVGIGIRFGYDHND